MANSFQQLYATLTESNPPPRKYLPFKQLNATPAPHNLPSLPEYTPTQLIYMCDPPRIYPSLPRYTLPFQQLYATLPESNSPSQNIPLFYNHMRPSQNLPPPPLPEYIPLLQLCASLTEFNSPSQNIPPFSTTITLYDPHRISPPSQNIFQFWERVVDSLTITCSV